ncbi:hypothetical protein MTO96_033594 [Rhipicephalus appendiculatus]
MTKTGSTMVADAIQAASSMCTEDMRGDTLYAGVQRNIIDVRTPSRENAERYVRVRQIVGLGRTNEVSAYEGTPHSTFKGVMRGIPLAYGPDVTENTVNDLNPLTLAAKHIGSTGTVVVGFDGQGVPNILRYTPHPCALFALPQETRHLLCYDMGPAQAGARREGHVMKRLVQKYLPIDSSPSKTYIKYS